MPEKTNLFLKLNSKLLAKLLLVISYMSAITLLYSN